MKLHSAGENSDVAWDITNDGSINDTSATDRTSRHRMPEPSSTITIVSPYLVGASMI